MSIKRPIRDVATHNDEELLKISKDLVVYCTQGLRKIKEAHGAEIPLDLKPHVDFYQSVISASSSYLVDTDNWFK